jgi:hypothetical protein
MLDLKLVGANPVRVEVALAKRGPGAARLADLRTHADPPSSRLAKVLVADAEEVGFEPSAGLLRCPRSRR